MATELEKILAEETAPASEVSKVEPTKVEIKHEETQEELEAKQKAEQLANLNKAVADETARLQKIREDQRRAKLGLEPQEEELPQIDLKDPNAKAWNKRIQDEAAPARQELEKAKEERRLFTLKQFLADKPSLAKNPEKVKEMMEVYDRLKISTELTNEGIQMDLEKAYAATHADELISAAQQARVDRAREDALFSAPAVSRGSTAYSNESPKQRKYSEEEIAQLAKWNMTPKEHADMVEEQRKKDKVG